MKHESKPVTAVVIGAGVTGLTAAHALRKRRHTVHIIERGHQPGGAIQSLALDGYLVEAGPNTMLVNEQRLLDFFSELGLDPELVEASPLAKNRFIVRDGHPVPAPLSPLAFLRTPLFSAKAKWRLLGEPFVSRGLDDHEDSVAAFTIRRLGEEVLDYAVNPLIGGIYAGDPERLSMRHAFPKIHRLESGHGSLLRGGLAAARSGRKSGQPRFKSRSISFRSGLHALIDALVRSVGDSLYTGGTAAAIEPGPPWRVNLVREGREPRQIEADAVLLATPAYETARLPLKVEGDPLRALVEIKYPPVASLALGFRREQVRHPLDGYGMLIPEKESRFRILGTLFNSSLFPERTPPGHVLLTTFVGGTRRPEVAALGSDELQRVVIEDLNALLGIDGPPAFSHTTTWPRAIPQYNLGFGRILEAIERAEAAHPGLFIGGQSRDGVSVGDCIRAGWRLAERAAP